MTAEPTHIPILVSNNPVIYLWQPVCKCLTGQHSTSGDAYCPVHGYPTKFYPVPILEARSEPYQLPVESRKERQS